MISSDDTPEHLTIELHEIDVLWAETRSDWNDRMAEEFESKVIGPLKSAISDLRTTLFEHSTTQL